MYAAGAGHADAVRWLLQQVGWGRYGGGTGSRGGGAPQSLQEGCWFAVRGSVRTRRAQNQKASVLHWCGTVWGWCTRGGGTSCLWAHEQLGVEEGL